VTALEEAVAAMEAATGTSLPYLDMRVVFDEADGRPAVLSHADQRDMRKAQVQIGTDPELDPLGFNRACAWAYLRRTQDLPDTWAEFDSKVAFVIPIPEQTTADPTGPALAG
jgi:hypothetical protein